MGFLLEKSIIIEFNGLPATGKTTIANSLFLLLENNDIHCIKSFVKYKWQTNGYTVFLSLRLIKLYFLLQKFAKRIKPRQNRLTHIIGEMYHFRSYWDFCSNKNDRRVLVVDQGLIQSIVSIGHVDKIEDYDSLKRVLEYYNENKIIFISVNCILDPQLSFDRIKDRPENSARMHKIPREQLLNAMEKQADNFSGVRNCFSDVMSIKTITVDTTCDPNENARIILNQLLKDGYITQ